MCPCQHITFTCALLVAEVSSSSNMRRASKGSRAPLAPLQGNSLRDDSARKSVAKGDSKQSFNSYGRKPPSKPQTARVNRADPELANSAQDTGNHAARAKSPAKVRKSVQLVTTAAAVSRTGSLAKVKQGRRKSAEATSVKQSRPVLSANAQSVDLAAKSMTDAESTAQHAARASTLPQATTGNAASPAGAGMTVPASVQADECTPPYVTLRHWQTPATPPSINTLLGLAQSPPGGVCISRDGSCQPAHATPQSAVDGAGTPQDFSDVFDLDVVCL